MVGLMYTLWLAEKKDKTYENFTNISQYFRNIKEYRHQDHKLTHWVDKPINK